MSVTDETEHEEVAAATSGDAHWQQKMQRMRNRKLPERTLVFYDEDARTERDRTELELIASKSEKDEHKTAAAQAEFDQAEAAYNETVVEFTFRAIPRPQYEALIIQHPPTERQEREGMAYNEQTFAPALVAACAVDPMSLDDAKTLFGQTEEAGTDDNPELVVTDGGILNMGESLAMFRTCTQLCERMRVDVGKGSQSTPG